MTTTRQLLLDANNPLAALINSDIASLASTGVAEAATAISNVQADSAGLGYAYCRGVLGLGGPASAWTAGSAMYVWFLTADDGTNYSTAAATSGTSATPPCSRAPDLIFPLENNTSAQIITAEGALPNCAKIKALFWNNGGQAVKSTGNSLNVYQYTDQMLQAMPCVSRNNRGRIDLRRPLNRSHSLNQGRMALWKVLPNRYGGQYWWDLAGCNLGALTSMSGGAAATNGFRPNAPPGGWGSVLFDGSAGYVDCGNSSVLNPPAITVSAWVYFTSLSNAYTAVVSRNDGAFHYQLLVKSNGKLALYVGTATGDAFYDGTGGITLTTGVWYYLTLVYSAAGLVGYVNGVQDAAVAGNGPLTAVNAHTVIGADTVNAGRVLAGYADEVSLWSRVLIPAGVPAAYALSRQGCPGVFNRVGVPFPTPATPGTQPHGWEDWESPVLAARRRESRQLLPGDCFRA